jgi:hypothetical protein
MDAMRVTKGRTAAVAVMLLLGGVAGQGSSHREAPGITKTPKLDGTDFYMFRSYETGRSGFVTLVANYIPLQDPYGGPNYYTLDTDAVYEIHVDNNADAREDITFQFRPSITVKDLSVMAGNMSVPVPLINIGPIGPDALATQSLNREESYTVHIVRGDRRAGAFQQITNVPTAAARSASRSTTSATSRSRTPATTPTTTSTTSRSPAATTAACSSASARTRSSSTWERRSTS